MPSSILFERSVSISSNTLRIKLKSTLLGLRWCPRGVPTPVLTGGRVAPALVGGETRRAGVLVLDEVGDTATLLAPLTAALPITDVREMGTTAPARGSNLTEVEPTGPAIIDARDSPGFPVTTTALDVVTGERVFSICMRASRPW